MRSVLILVCTSFSIVSAEEAGVLNDQSEHFHTNDYTITDSHPMASPADTGINGDILAMTTFGGELAVGGLFFQLGGVTASRVGAWDGSAWHGMSSLPLGPAVYSLHEHNGELYAGTFLPTLFKWTGTDWTSIGPDLAPLIDYGKIYAMETYNTDLIIAGAFAYDTLQPPYIAKWNGVGFDSLGVSPVRNVRSLSLYNGELVVGGSGLASWNGTTWSDIGTGITGAHPGSNATVYATVEYNSWLIAAGYFNEAGGNSATNIARWNGSYWLGLNGTLNKAVYDVIEYDGLLIAGGEFSNSGAKQVSYIAYWDGADWSPLGEIDSTVHDLHIYDGKLVASGSFLTAGGGHIAWWDTTTTTWRPMDYGLTCCMGTMGSIRLDDGIIDCGDLSDQTVDVVDLTSMIDHLFINLWPLCCSDEADYAPLIFGSPQDGFIDVADLTAMIDHLFINLPSMPVCP